MNALQRLQETQETLQGVAARLRIDLSDMTVPEQAGVVATQAIKLHDELVNARTSLGEMERQRDDARREHEAMADALGKVKALVESQGVPVGAYWSDIPLAVDTMIAEADTKPREKVPAFTAVDPTASRCTFCHQPQRVVRRLISGEGGLICDDCVALCVEILEDEGLKPLRADSSESLIKAIEDRATKAERELARFQRADVGERVREIEEESREQSFTVMRMLADGRLSKDELINVPGLAIKMCEVVNERGELLAICRQQQAEIEQLKAEADKLARKESRAAQDLENLRLYWEGIRERFNRLPRFFLRDEDKAKRRWFFCVDDVLSALEPVVKESLTTERKPVCSHCNDTHRIGIRWCSRCPRPCKEKCHDGNGYCRQTPCPCDCHKVASEAKS